MDESAQKLVAKLVKFQEVHFSSAFDEDSDEHEDYRDPRFGYGGNAAILRALAAASCDGEDSRLKVLTLDEREPYDPVESAALVEARKKLTVNLVGSPNLSWDNDEEGEGAKGASEKSL